MFRGDSSLREQQLQQQLEALQQQVQELQLQSGRGGRQRRGGRRQGPGQHQPQAASSHNSYDGSNDFSGYASSARAYSPPPTLPGETEFRQGLNAYIHCNIHEAIDKFAANETSRHPCIFVMMFRIYYCFDYMFSDYASMQDFYRQQVAKCIHLLEQEAHNNNPDAQSCLGDCYFYGLGRPPDLQQAYRWHTRAAEQGHPIAQNALACAYLSGKGIGYHPFKAVYWFRAAADQGYAVAQHNLSLQCESGKGMPGKRQDFAEGKRLCSLAAEQGFPPAQHGLGNIYKSERNYEEARKWHQKAADQGYEPAREALLKHQQYDQRASRRREQQRSRDSGLVQVDWSGFPQFEAEQRRAEQEAQRHQDALRRRREQEQRERERPRTPEQPQSPYDNYAEDAGQYNKYSYERGPYNEDDDYTSSSTRYDSYGNPW